MEEGGFEPPFSEHESDELPLTPPLIIIFFMTLWLMGLYFSINSLIVK
jgi:hypothetical protein